MLQSVRNRFNRSGSALLVLAMITGSGVSTLSAQAVHASPVQVLIQGQNMSFLGVGLREVDSTRAKELKLKEERGAEITSVQADSPAEKAGFQKGDVVLDYNGQHVEGAEQFGRLVRETPPGRTVKVGVWRNGGSQTLTATVAAKNSKALGEMLGGLRGLNPSELNIPEIPRVFTMTRSAMLGVDAEGIEGQLAQFFGVKQGVLVRSVFKNTPAEKAGLKAGDVVTKVDGTDVGSTSELTSALRARTGKSFPLTVMREKRESAINVTLDAAETPAGRVTRRIDQNFQ